MEEVGWRVPTFWPTSGLFAIWLSAYPQHTHNSVCPPAAYRVMVLSRRLCLFHIFSCLLKSCKRFLCLILIFVLLLYISFSVFYLFFIALLFSLLLRMSSYFHFQLFFFFHICTRFFWQLYLGAIFVSFLARLRNPFLTFSMTSLSASGSSSAAFAGLPALFLASYLVEQYIAGDGTHHDLRRFISQPNCSGFLSVSYNENVRDTAAGAWCKQWRHRHGRGAPDFGTATWAMDISFIRCAVLASSKRRFAAFLTTGLRDEVALAVSVWPILALMKNWDQLWLVIKRRYSACEQYFETRLGTGHILLVSWHDDDIFSIMAADRDVLYPFCNYGVVSMSALIFCSPNTVDLIVLQQIFLWWEFWRWRISKHCGIFQDSFHSRCLAFTVRCRRGGAKLICWIITV